MPRSPRPMLCWLAALGALAGGRAGADEGVVVSGVVLDAAGNPLPWVSVGLTPRRPGGGILRDPEWRTIADGQGRFALPPVPPGTYDVAPVRDLQVVAGATRAEQLPEADRARLEPGKDALIVRPLPATFVRFEVTLEKAEPAVEVTLKAVPHATLTARFVDAIGQPAPAGAGYDMNGYVDRTWWRSDFDPVPGRFDAISALVPLGLRSVSVETAHDDVWWTWSPDVARQAGDGASLGRVQGDLPSILAERVKGSTLEVRVKAEGAKALGRFDVSVSFPNKRGGIAADGFAHPDEVRPGVYRLDHGLLPARVATVRVLADGYKGIITREFQFPSGGLSGTIDLTLKAGDRDLNDMVNNPEPVSLLDAQGRPIPQADPAAQVQRAIDCRAVDADTGRPVAGAAVEFGMEQHVDDAGEQNWAWLEQGKATTDADGRFVVLVPEKYLPDPAPRRVVHARATIAHPGYVTYFDTADTREIASKGVSAASPEFVAVRLVPARTLTGRLLGPEGKPRAGVSIYKQYDLNNYPRDAETPKTDADGRFRAKVPVKAALKLEFRAAEAARNYVDVPADRTDLGDVRLARGVRVVGRVVDADGAPVPWISVTTPSLPNREGQPNFNYTTDKDGRFRTDDLPPGRYLAHVGQIHRTDAGADSPMAVKDAPGVFVDIPFEIRNDGAIAPELILKPVEHVTFVATLAPIVPGPKSKDDQRLFIPYFTVKGRVGGVDWFNTSTVATEAGDRSYTVLVPRGLTDATLNFGAQVQRFRLEAGAPELFGPSVKLGRVDADQLSIAVYRPCPAIIEVRLAPGARLAARHARQGEMEALGVVFDPKQPTPYILPEGDLARVYTLPGEDVDLTATAPGFEPATARVKLEEGETRAVPLAPRPKP